MDHRQYVSIGTTARATPVNNMEILYPNGYDRNRNSSGPLVTVRDTAGDDDDYSDGNSGFESHSPSENVTVTIKIGSGGDGIVTETDKKGMFIREEITYSPAHTRPAHVETEELDDIRQRMLGLDTGTEETEYHSAGAAAQSGSRDAGDASDVLHQDNHSHDLTTGETGDHCTGPETESATGNTGDRQTEMKQNVNRQNSLYDEYERYVAPNNDDVRTSNDNGMKTTTKPKVKIVKYDDQRDHISGRGQTASESGTEPSADGEDFMAYLKELRGETALETSETNESLSNEAHDEDFGNYLQRLRETKSNNSEHGDGCTENSRTDKGDESLLVLEDDSTDFTVDLCHTDRTLNSVPEDVITISDEDEFFDVSERPDECGLVIEEIIISDDDEASGNLASFDFGSLTKSKTHCGGGNGMFTDSQAEVEETPYPGDEIIVVHKPVIKLKRKSKCDNATNEMSGKDPDGNDDSDSEKDKEDEEGDEHDEGRKRDSENDSDDDGEGDPRGSNGGASGDQNSGHNNDFDCDDNGDNGYDRDGNGADYDQSNSDNDEPGGRENEGYFSPGLRSRSTPFDTSCDSNSEIFNTDTCLENCSSLTLDIEQSEECTDEIFTMVPALNTKAVKSASQTTTDSASDTSQQFNHPANRSLNVTVLQVGGTTSYGVPESLQIPTSTSKQACIDRMGVKHEEKVNGYRSGLLVETSNICVFPVNISRECDANCDIPYLSERETCLEDCTNQSSGETSNVAFQVSSVSDIDFGSLEGATGMDFEETTVDFASGTTSPMCPEDREVFEILDYTECLHNVDCQFQSISNYEVEEFDSDGDVPKSQSNTGYDTDPSIELLSPPAAFKDKNMCNNYDESPHEEFQIMLATTNQETELLTVSNKCVLVPELSHGDIASMQSSTNVPHRLGGLDTMSLSDVSSDSCCSNVDYEEEFEKAIECTELNNTLTRKLEDLPSDEILFQTELEDKLGMTFELPVPETDGEYERIGVLKDEIILQNLPQDYTNLPYIDKSSQEQDCERCSAKVANADVEDVTVEISESPYTCVSQEQEDNLRETDEIAPQSHHAENELEWHVQNHQKPTNINQDENEIEASLKEETFSAHDSADADRDIDEVNDITMTDQDHLLIDVFATECKTEQEDNTSEENYQEHGRLSSETRKKAFLINQKPRLISYFVPYLIKDEPKLEVNAYKIRCIRRVCLLRYSLLNGRTTRNDTVIENLEKNNLKLENITSDLEELKRKCDMLESEDGSSGKEEPPGDIIQLGSGFYFFGTGERLNLPVGPRLRKYSGSRLTNNIERSCYFRGKPLAKLPSYSHV